jgi:hypothetical protein
MSCAATQLKDNSSRMVHIIDPGGLLEKIVLRAGENMCQIMHCFIRQDT